MLAEYLTPCGTSRSAEEELEGKRSGKSESSHLRDDESRVSRIAACRGQGCGLSQISTRAIS